jgi:tetratricopeptide (TPR) repeat protein
LRGHSFPSGTAVTAAVVLVWLVVFISPGYAQTDPGQAAYVKGGCEMCHGADAQGAMGPGLVPLVASADEFAKVVRGGLGQMPPIPRSQVSDADVAAIHAYLKRLGGPVAPPAAASGSASGVDDVNVRIDRARRDHDLTALAAAIESTSSALSQLAVAERSAHVAAAFAAWEWVVQQPQPPPESAKLVDRAIEHVERAIQLNDRVADTRGFLAALNALRLTLGSSPGPAVAARIAAELDRAKALDAEGPRVLLLTGIAGVLAPASVTGGIDAAEQVLRRAQQLLPEAPTGFAWPAWTAADAAAWLGRARQQRGDPAGARQAYEEALRLRPNDQWIGKVLLPSVVR